MANPVISALQNPFVDQLSFGLMKKAILGLDFIPYVRVETGVNGALQLNTISSAPLFTATLCDDVNAATGSTTFGKQTLTTCDLNWPQKLCLRELDATYYGQFLSQSAMGIDNLGSFQDYIMGALADEVGKAVNKLVWQGSNSTPSYVAGLAGNNLFCDGFLQFAYEASATTINVTRSGWTNSNSFAYVDYLYQQATADMKGGAPSGQLYLYVQPDDFDKYLMNRRNLNLFNDPSMFTGEIKEIKHWGTRNLVIVSTNGLDGAASGTAILTYKENIVFGTLATSDVMGLTGLYDPYVDAYRTKFFAKVGTGFVFPEHVVSSIR